MNKIIELYKKYTNLVLNILLPSVVLVGYFSYKNGSSGFISTVFFIVSLIIVSAILPIILNNIIDYILYKNTITRHYFVCFLIYIIWFNLSWLYIDLRFSISLSIIGLFIFLIYKIPILLKNK